MCGRAGRAGGREWGVNAMGRARLSPAVGFVMPAMAEGAGAREGGGG